jgi:hypothetical protein
MKKVQSKTIFKECQRCHQPKHEDIWGVCKKCETEIGKLNRQ